MAGGPFLSDEMKKRIVQIYCNTTLIQSEIADALRISQNSVSRVLKEYKDGKLQTEMETNTTSGGR